MEVQHWKCALERSPSGTEGSRSPDAEARLLSSAGEARHRPGLRGFGMTRRAAGCEVGRASRREREIRGRAPPSSRSPFGVAHAASHTSSTVVPRPFFF